MGSALREELDKRRLELEGAEKEQAARVAQERALLAEEAKAQQQELLKRASDLVNAEEALHQERVEIQRSRQGLAMVQAHVVSMLDRAERASSPNGNRMQTHRLDSVDTDQVLDDDTGAKARDLTEDCDPDRSPDGMWSMDWTSTTLITSHAEQTVDGSPKSTQ